MKIADEPISTYKVLTSGEQLQLDPANQYSIYHRGTAEDGSADANDILVLCKGGAAGSSDYASGVGKGIFSKGMVISVTGVDGIFFKAEGGAPCLTVTYGGKVNKLKG